MILTGPDGRKIAVQAKRWQGAVGVEAVQQVMAARARYRCDAALVVTNPYFTEQAERLAASNGVELWDRDRLLQELLKAPATGHGASGQQAEARPAPPGRATR